MIEHHIAMFVVLLSSGLGRTPEEVEGPEKLKSDARATGGMTVELEDNGRGDPKSLAAISALAQLEVEIATNPMVLDLTIARPLDKWSPVQISLRGKKREIELLFPHELPPCSTH